MGERVMFEDKGSQKTFEATMAKILKEYGLNGSQVLGDAKVQKIPRTSFGSFKIDELTGGGIPKGRILEVYGPESSGKTTVALHAIAEVQAQGGLAVFIDAENALDVVYAQALGVDVANLVVAQPDSAEDCLKIAEIWINSGICGIVVLDSVAAMVTVAELKGEIGDSYVGVLARLMSQGLRKIAYACNRTGTPMIFINQIREKIGVMFGNPETTTGGRALRFYSTIRLEIRPAEIVKKEGEAVSRKTKVKVVKNKVAPPFREDFVDIEFGEGISKAGEILDYGVDLGLIEKSGAWFRYNGHSWQGRENAKKALKENPELFHELDAVIRSFLNPEEIEIEVEAEYIPVAEEELDALLAEEGEAVPEESLE